MRFLFAGAEDFNQPIGDWDVSNVLDHEDMFFECTRNDKSGPNFGIM